MKVFVTSLTDHRIDTMLASLCSKALDALHIGHTSIYDDDVNIDVCIMFNGVLTPEGQEKINRIASHMPILYMYDDCDLDIPENVICVSQFTNMGDLWFPISKFACFHTYWDAPIKLQKKYAWFYGGTYKERRDYSELSGLKGLLLAGDSREWGAYICDRVPTIRDMDTLYHLMAMCKATLIVPDPLHDGVNTPLRFYEAVFCGMEVKIDGAWWAPKDIKASINKNEVLRQLKDLLNAALNY